MVNKKKQTERQNQWIRENRERCELLLPKGTKEKWKALADAEGITLAQFIYRKIETGL